MHRLQVQDADGHQALQAVRRRPSRCARGPTDCVCSFELGGEKKTKGAALQFVSSLTISIPPCFCSPHPHSDCISASSRRVCLHVLATYLRSCPHYVICNTIVHRAHWHIVSSPSRGALTEYVVIYGSRITSVYIMDTFAAAVPVSPTDYASAWLVYTTWTISKIGDNRVSLSLLVALCHLL